MNLNNGLTAKLRTTEEQRQEMLGNLYMAVEALRPLKPKAETLIAIDLIHDLELALGENKWLELKIDLQQELLDKQYGIGASEIAGKLSDTERALTRVCDEREKIEALAREAAGLISEVFDWTDGNEFPDELYYPIEAFLSRPEVKALKGVENG